MTAVPYITNLPESDGSSSLHVSLLDAATKADVTAVLQSLREGADPHVMDAKGRTVIGCTIAGERWEEADASNTSFLLEQRLEILKALLHHEKISLAALNAPLDAMRGVTPLGLAAWLNIPDIVRTLLNECPGLVSVNGMDASGATALMYSARDGRVEVVHDLLMHGARPDYRDINHRSSIQYALKHPQVLWLCESALRRHRASESSFARRSVSRSRSREQSNTEPHAIVCHPRLALKSAKQDLQDKVETLVSAVKADDPQALRSLLSPPSSSPLSTPPPFLINYPDAEGWCAIHHCMTSGTPSLEVLDVLYHAGADLSLYTRSSHGTPLHCLARRASLAAPHSIHEFVQHLVLDLRAPLGAKDAADETCLHIAAEHGHSVEILLALLACDTSRSVQEMRNSRGLTPFEVAQPQFRAAFGPDFEANRSASAASMRTIKPSTASVKAASALLCADALRVRVLTAPRKQHGVRGSISDLNIHIFPHNIIENLLSASRELSSEPEDVDVTAVEDLLQQTIEMGEDVLIHMQSRLNHAAEELITVRQKLSTVESMITDIERVAEVTYGTRLVTSDPPQDDPHTRRRRTTDSQRSESTAVSSNASSSDLQQVTEKHAGHAYNFLAVQGPPGARPQLTLATAEPPHSVYPSPLHDPRSSFRPTKSLVDLRHSTSQTPEDKGFLKLPWVKDITRKRSKSDIHAHVDASERASFLWIGDSLEPPASGVSRVKAWFRKKLLPELPSQPVVTKSADAPYPADVSRGRPSITSRISLSSGVRPQGCRHGYVTARRVMLVTDADLRRIREYIGVAERYINHANRSVAQARRLLTRGLEHRKTQLLHVKNMRNMDNTSLLAQRHSDNFEFLPVTIPSSTRDSQLVFPKPPSIASSFSSTASISSATVKEDNDIRALRRLLTRKIDSRTENAHEHTGKAMIHLQIARDVTRTLRRNLA